MESSEKTRPGESNCNIITEELTPGCYVKARHVLAFMGFLGLFNMYSLRTNLSVAIVAMVNSTVNDDDGDNSTTCPDQGGSSVNNGTKNGVFDLDRAEQGLLLGCYYYGYIFTCMPGGYLAKRFGVRLVFGLSTLLASILTLLFPIAASASFPLMVALRIMIGFFQGVCSASTLSAWGRWAPPLERSSLISFTISGSSFGTFVSLPIAGVIADNLGWEAVFYFTGGGALLWSVIWLGIIHSSPQSHPRISEHERRYIVESIGNRKKDNSAVKTRTPWVGMLTSLPVWGIISVHIVSNWGNYTLISMLPTYMANILRFNLSASGGLSALPYIMQFLFVVSGGYVTDYIRRHHWLSTIAVRKLNTGLGLVVPAIFLVLAGYIGCNVAAAVAFFCIAVGFNGLTVPGSKSNPVDIAPKYGGIIFGISNTLANIPGFLAPQVVGLMLLYDDSISRWQAVFWLAAGGYLLGALVYFIVGTADVQPWAEGKAIGTAKNQADVVIENQGAFSNNSTAKTSL